MNKPLTSKFKPGDIVWAEARGSPAWPAEIVSILQSGAYKVSFFNENTNANIMESKIFDYQTNRQTFKKHCKQKLFPGAIQKADEKVSILHGLRRSALRPGLRSTSIRNFKRQISENTRKRRVELKKKISLRKEQKKKRIKKLKIMRAKKLKTQKRAKKIKKISKSSKLNQVQNIFCRVESEEHKQNQQAGLMIKNIEQISPQQQSQMSSIMIDSIKQIKEIDLINEPQISNDQKNLILRKIRDQTNRLFYFTHDLSTKDKKHLLGSIIQILQHKSLSSQTLFQTRLCNTISSIIAKLEKLKPQNENLIDDLQREFQLRKNDIINKFTCTKEFEKMHV